MLGAPPLVYTPATRVKHALLEAGGWRVAHVSFREWASTGTSEARQVELLERAVAAAGVDLPAAVAAALAAAKPEAASQ
jgi:hypothetical protein